MDCHKCGKDMIPSSLCDDCYDVLRALQEAKRPQPSTEAGSECMNLLHTIVENEEVTIFGRPEKQMDANEPRYSLGITGPERLIRTLTDILTGM